MEVLLPMSESPAQRAMRSRIAAHLSWAKTPDRTARTASARGRFEERFLNAVDPGRILPEAERLRRAQHAKKAYFLDLARRSAQARAKKAGRVR